jgi:hypothetical protein
MDEWTGWTDTSRLLYDFVELDGLGVGIGIGIGIGIGNWTNGRTGLGTDG